MGWGEGLEASAAYGLALVGGDDLCLAAHALVDDELDELALEGHGASRLGLECLEERGEPDAAYTGRTE